MLPRPFQIPLPGLLLACGAPEPTPDSTQPEPEPAILTVLSANVGNLDEVFGGPCPSEPYHGALCSIDGEEAIRSRLQEVDPDVAILMEVLDADYCDEETWEGDEDRPCTGAPDRDPYQQIRRITGDAYTLTCDGIAHYDCIAVRADRIAVEECPAGELCMGSSDTPEHPPACEENGGITSISRVHAEIDGVEVHVVAAHPLNATTHEDDTCRLAQYEQAFETLAGERPTLVAGDMNMDPYRLPDWFESGRYWHTVVGEENRFTAHSVTEDPPTATWGGSVTLDYILSDWLSGHDCQVLGEDGGTEPLDGDEGRMDHKAVRCALEIPVDL